MADYINREKLLEHIKDVPTWEIDDKGMHDTKYPKGMFDCEDVVSSIENAPAAEVEPLQHGHWIYKPDCRVTVCSVCHRSVEEAVDYPRCMFCGAIMDEEDWMKEITVVTTVEATDIVRFEDSPDAYEDIINFMDNAWKDKADSVAKQFAESDDVNVKVQFFVNDADSASSDKVGDNLQSVDKCKRD